MRPNLLTKMMTGVSRFFLGFAPSGLYIPQAFRECEDKMIDEIRKTSGQGWRLLPLLVACLIVITSPYIFAGQVTISSLPYTASNDNDTFTIAGTKLTSTGNGITVTGSNVVINLGSDTIQFGTGTSGNARGIAINATNNVKVLGGTLLKTGQNGSGANGIRVNNSNNILFDGTDIFVDGHNAQCVNIDGGYSGTYNVNFDGGEWRNNSESFTSRETYSGAVFYSGSFPATAGSYDVRIANIDITNGPCQGIIVKGEFIIEGCNITTDARNVYWDSVWLWQNQQAPIGQSADNSYLILCRGGEPGTIIRNNTLASGNQYGGSRGILLENCAGTSANPIEVYNNHCTIHAGPSGENLDGVTRVIRMRAIDGGTTSYIHVYDNTFIGIADNDPATTAIGMDVAVLNFGFPNSSDTCIVERNRFIAKSTTTGTKVKACESTFNGTTFNHIVRNNYFSGSSVIIYLGDEYNGMATSKFRFQGDTLAFDPDFTFNKKTWNIGYGGSNSLDNIAVDCKFVNGASDTNITWYASSGTNEMTLARTLDIQVLGSNALPVLGALVSVVNNYGQTVLSGTTSANGRLSGPVSYWYSSDDNPDSTSYNNFSIKVKKLLDSTISSFTVNANSASPTSVLQNTLGDIGSNNAPSVPVNLTPINSDTLNTTPIALRVINSTDIDLDQLTYDFFISTNSGFTSLVDSAKNVAQSLTQTQATFNNFAPVNGQRYYWRVRAYDGTSYSSFSTATSFWYVNLSTGNECLTAPGVPGLSSPANSSSVTSLRPTLCVVNSVPATGCTQGQIYTFEVYSDSTLTTLATSNSSVGENAGGTTCWTLVTSLQPGRFYWWRARSTNGITASNWTSTYKFSTPNNVPTTPAPQSPANGAIVATLTPTLIVNASTDADGTSLTYDFQLATNSTFTTIVRSTSIVGQGSQISWTPSPSLSNNQIYYWRVRAKDAIANSNWSTTRSFTVNIVTNSAPTTPTITSPAHNGKVNKNHPTLTVGNSTDANGDVLTYEFELYDSTGNTLISSVTGVTQGVNYTRWDVTTTLDDRTDYHWRSRAFDGTAYSPWTTSALFTVEIAATNNPPSQPTPLSPINNDVVTTAPVILAITNGIDPDGDPLVYDFQIALDSAFNSVVSTRQNVTETSGQTEATFSGFTPTEGNRYWWRVRSEDTAGEQSSYTTPTSFTFSGLSTGGDEYTADAAWPIDGQSVPNSRPTLRAQNIAAAGVNFYYFDLSTDSNFVNSVANSEPIAEQTEGFTEWIVPTELNEGETYFWRVRANNYAYSPITSFVVSAEETVIAYPNPVCFNEGETVMFKLPSEPVELWIRNVAGETVRHETGLTGDWVWDGKNESGNLVAFGVYLWYVSGNSLAQGKIAVKPKHD